MLVRALKTCFFGNCLRQAGAEFEYDAGEGELPSVLEAVEDEAPVDKPVAKVAKKAAKKAKKAPETTEES